MADIYVRSTDGDDADNGTTWALAKATVAGALAIAAAGDTIFVSDNHAETQASTLTWTIPGTAASPCRILCVDDSAEPPAALATTATVTTTSNFAMNVTGFAYIYGITFNCGTGGNSANLNIGNQVASSFVFEACSLRIVNTSTSSRINLQASNTSGPSARVELINTTLSFASVSQGVVNRSTLIWRGVSSALLNTIPTTLFITPTSGMMAVATIMGADLSAAGSGKNLVSLAGANSSYFFADCKLGSAVSIVSGSSIGPHGTEVTVVNCDSGDTNYRYHKQNFQGTIAHETTIVLSGGASDGATPVSRKATSTADSKYFSPLCSDWAERWNEEASGGDVNAQIRIITFEAAALQDDEIWLEAEVLDTSGVPLGSFSNDRSANILASPADQNADGSTWTGSARQNSFAYTSNDVIAVQGKLFRCTVAGTSASSEPGGYATANDGDSVTDGTATFRAGWRQYLEVASIPAEKGLIRGRVCLAEPSKVVYFDPRLLLNGT